jgi:hypothetical protein
MIGKGSKLYSIFRMKCPRCHVGEMYEDPNPYNFGKLTRMHASCSHCGEDFKREPGFFFGAAYVSYALTVAVWIAVLVALITFDALGWISYSFFEDTLLFFASGVITLVLLLPYLYRLSRSLWLNIFIKYEGQNPEFKKPRDL